jgi:hypothetical protein
MSRVISNLLLSLFVAAVAGCGVLQGDQMNQKWFDPEIFSTVKTSSEGKSACTPPDIDTPFYTGISINAPIRVGFNSTRVFVIPVCVNGTVTEMGPKTLLPMLFAVDLTTQQTYSGVAYEHKLPKVQGVDIDFVPPRAAPSIAPDMLQGLRGGLVFNADLVAVLKLPRKPGTYQIHLERGELKSNVMTVNVLEGSL